MKTNVTSGVLDQPLDHHCLAVFLSNYIFSSHCYICYIFSLFPIMHFSTFFIFFFSLVSNIIIYVYNQYHHFVFSLVSNITFSQAVKWGEFNFKSSPLDGCSILAKRRINVMETEKIQNVC